MQKVLEYCRILKKGAKMFEICPDMANLVAKKIKTEGLNVMNDSVRVLLEEDVRQHRQLRDLPDWFVVRANDIDVLFEYLKTSYEVDE